MTYVLTLFAALAQTTGAAGLVDGQDPASHRLTDLILDPLHLLLVLTPIVLLLVLRKFVPKAFTGRLEEVAVFYPLPLTMAGVFVGLTPFEQPAARVCIGLIAWLVSASLFKVAKPWLQRWFKGTFGADAELPV